MVSIIIPCFDQAECTRACWAALQNTLPRDATSEVIFIDNHSSDGTAEFLATLPSEQARIISNAENLGFAKACNQGAAVARGECLLFLNNDTEPRSGWLEPLLATLRAHAGTAIVGSKLLYPDGRVQHAGVVVEEKSRASGAHFRLQHVHRLDAADAPWVNEPRECQCVTGACLLIRRAVFEAAGGFDERFRNGHEDIDLCFRVRALGHAVRYCPASVVVHRESISAGRHAYDAENTRLLWERWAGKIESDERVAYAVAGKLDWLELRLGLEELKGFLDEMRARETAEPEKRRGPVALLRRGLQRFLGVRELAMELKTTRRSLVRVRRCLGSLQRIATKLELAAQSHTRQ